MKRSFIGTALEQYIENGTLDFSVFYEGKTKSLSISRMNVNDADIEFIASWLAEHPDTVTLNLNNNLISDAGAQQLAVILKQHTAIKTLNLQYNKIGNDGVKVLIDALDNIKDRSIQLDLTWNQAISKKGSIQLTLYSMREGSSHDHHVLFHGYVQPAIISDCPKLEDLAFKALLDQGLYHNGVNLPEDATKPYQDRVAAVLEQKIKKKTNEVMPVFLQSVIDDDIPTITALLDQYPWLLLQEAPKGLVIESKLTWQKFDVEGENALSITATLKKICMLDKLQPYIKKLDQTDLVKAANALSQWSTYEIHQVDGVDEIVIPQHIADCAQYLIDQLIVEPFPNVLPNGNPDIVHLSDKSEFAINYLFNHLLCPRTAVKLENLLDVELLLLAVYKAYVDNFSRFQNWEQRNAFCIRVIGLIQSVLTPETAKMFCESIKNVSRSLGPSRAITEVLISDLAKQHKLKGGESFYHSSRGSHLGLGFEFFCGIKGTGDVEIKGPFYLPVGKARIHWKNYVEQKQILFAKLRSNCSLSQSATSSCKF